MKVRVDDQTGLIDSAVRFFVTEAPASSVQLTISGADGQGHLWESTNSYRVGDDGELAIADPDEPWTTMEFVQPSAAPVVFDASDTGLDFGVRVTAGSESATTTVRREWGHDLRTEEISGAGWLLTIFRPQAPAGRRPGVIVVPGTIVGPTALAIAALLASHGYISATLFYTQREGLPDAFVQIPIESITAGMQAFAGLDDVDGDAVAVHCSSVGVQTALSALSHPGAIEPRAVIAVAPSHVVFQALRTDGPPVKSSALTFGGVDLPYVPVKAEKLMGQLIRNTLRRKLSRSPASMAMVMLPPYAAGLRDDAAVARAVIPVENIACPILAIAGEDDQSYPAADMARALIERRVAKAAEHSDHDLLLTFADVGHFVRPPATPTTVDRSDGLVAGGSPIAVGRAQREAWTAVLAFLAGHLRTRHEPA
jgi:dienelactone hydrolase